jgi:hypothetical protein
VLAGRNACSVNFGGAKALRFKCLAQRTTYRQTFDLASKFMLDSVASVVLCFNLEDFIYLNWLQYCVTDCISDKLRRHLGCLSFSRRFECAFLLGCYTVSTGNWLWTFQWCIMPESGCSRRTAWPYALFETSVTLPVDTTWRHRRRYPYWHIICSNCVPLHSEPRYWL